MKTYMPRINRVELAGRLVKDPELFQTESKKKVARFTLAVNERFKNSKGEYQEKTSFVPVVIWNGFAEKLLPHLKKGVGIVVDGKYNTRDYKNKDGQKRTAQEVIGRQIQVLTRTETIEHAATDDAPHDVADGTHGA